MPIRGKNPSTGRYRRDFYGKNRKDRDHSRNRRDFYGRNKSDIDHSRYRRDFFGHDLGDKRRENASRPHERPWRQTVGPGAPPTRASERRRKKREERQKKRDARRQRRRDRVAAKLPGNRRNPGFGGGNRDMDPIPNRGRGRGIIAGQPDVILGNRPRRRPRQGPQIHQDAPGRYGNRGRGRFTTGNWNPRGGQYGGNRDMDPIPNRGRGRGGAMTGGVWAGDKSKGIPGEWDDFKPTQFPGRPIFQGPKVTPGEIPGKDISGFITQQKPGGGRRGRRAPIAGQASEWGRQQYERSQQGNRRRPQRQGSGGWQVPDHLQGDLSHLPAHLRRYVDQQRGKSSGGGFMAGSNDFPEQREMRDQQRRKRQQLEDRRRQVQQRTPPGKQPAPPGMQWSRSGWTGKWVLMPIGAMT